MHRSGQTIDERARPVAQLRVQLVAIVSFSVLVAAIVGIGGAAAQQPPEDPMANVSTIEELVSSAEYDTDVDAPILRFYRAFFGREPDVSGARYWLGVRRAGASADEIAAFMAASTEFSNAFAGTTDSEYVGRVYRNVLGRGADDDGFAYWLAELRSGRLDRAGVVAWITRNPEFVDRYPYAAAPVVLPPVDREPPNILVVMTDDQRRDSMTSMPQTTRLVGDRGVTYTQGYVTTPSCCPSRASFLTGQYVHNNGVLTQDGPAFDEDRSIAKLLGDAGYLTAHVGKYVHYYDLGDRAPHWSRWTYLKGGYEGGRINIDGELQPLAGYSTTVLFDQATRYIEDFEGEDATPWYVQVMTTAPHRRGNQPPLPEPRYADAPVPPWASEPRTFEADTSDKPPFIYCCPGLTTQSYIRNVRTEMTRALYSVDDGVAALLATLAANGELDNTLVIYTSDNGWLYGDHDLHEKFTPYENSVGVPFMLRWDGVVEPGERSDAMVSIIDILPTALAAAGADAPTWVDGRSLLAGQRRQRRLTEYYHDPGNIDEIPDWASLTTATVQYTEWFRPGTDRVIFTEYYDLRNDPYQLTNLLGDADPSNDPAPSELAALSRQLRADRSCTGTACP